MHTDAGDSFRRSRCMAYVLAQDYVACAINVASVTSIAFE